MKLIKIGAILTVCLLFSNCLRSPQIKKDYPIKPVAFIQVRFTDEFWAPRLETNRKVTIPFAFKKCEETGRIDNFSKAAGLMEGKHVGRRYNDSDVFKVMEGAAYSLTLHPDPALEKYLVDLIAKIAASQEEDGYLFTARTIDPENPAEGSGPTRWSNLAVSHELYNVGHMYEAAVAHFMATNKRSFLDVAIKNADFIASVFGPGKRQGVPGHQEIEIGLVKLYRVTGNETYLNLAKFFLDERGKSHTLDESTDTSQFAVYTEARYMQKHKPVIEQEEAVGHAVRATYMYSGMADVAALTGNEDYIIAIGRIWENAVSKKMYITGGIGSSHEGEAFGENYELPNKTAYNETCAAIGHVMWNHRLFLLHGDAKYIDVLERTLYNGLISGVSFSGDLFFYPNPLESDAEFAFNQGALSRKPWFDCACCPGNVARFIPSIPGYTYAQKNGDLYVNLFVSGTAKLKLGENAVTLTQETSYPWEGAVKIQIDPDQEGKFTICVRIPGWTQNQPVPKDLYTYMKNSDEKVELKVNGKSVGFDLKKGFARIKRTWKKGDAINLNLPMPIRRVTSNDLVKENKGKVALERGPIVYCAEGIDNGGHVLSLILSDETPLKTEMHKDMLNGIVVITGKAIAPVISENGEPIEEKEQDFLAIPYYAWSHRGPGEMTVWLVRK